MAATSGTLSALRAERNRFVAFTFATSDLVAETDLDGRILFVAGTAEAFFGCSASDLTGRELYELIAAGDDVALRSSVDRLLMGRRLPPISVRLLGTDGMQTEVRISGYRLPDTPDRLFFSLCQAMPRPYAGRDHATHDSESGLLDRESFGQEIAASALRTGAQRMALLDIVDLSRVRSGIDGAADATLLEDISTLLRSHALEGRIAGRLDDEKFGLVPAANVDLDALSGDIKSAVDAASTAGEKILVGAHSVSLDADGISEADAAHAVLYTLSRFCKADDGAFAFSTLSEGCRAMHAETRDWMDRIKQTIRDDAFRLAFQPIVSLEDATVQHYEALSRLPAAVRSSPFRFVTMAEQLGHIAEFDLAVLKRVIALTRDNAQDPVTPVAVNVSGRSLTTPDFADRFLQLVSSYEDPGASLLIEVTESSKITDLAVARRTLAAIRALGAPVCLDDFGAGAPAFEYLREIEVDFLKIDGSFVQEIGGAGFDQAFVQSIATLCESLDIRTIAEQVEDQETANRLRGIGITHGQGFLYGPPGERIGWAGARGEPVSPPDPDPPPPHRPRALIERAFKASQKNTAQRSPAIPGQGVAS